MNKKKFMAKRKSLRGHVEHTGLSDKRNFLTQKIDFDKTLFLR